MYYSTKARSTVEKDYVVIRHPQKPTGNVWMGGLKFCNGVAVVERGSKVYRMLGKNPIFRNRKEFTLDWLPKFGFRTKDVLVIFGKDIYYSYLKAVGLGQDLKPLPKTEEAKDEAVVEKADESLEEVGEEVPTGDEEQPVLATDSDGESTEVVGYTADDVKEIKEELAEEINDPEFPEEEEEEEIPELSTEEVIEAHKEMGLCVHIKDDGEVCKNRVSKGSPSGHYCFGHIKKDPGIKKEES